MAFDDIANIFKELNTELPWLKNNEGATAILTLACVISVLETSLRRCFRELQEDIDHRICMGVRHGLFGSDASSGESLNSVIYEAIQEILNNDLHVVISGLNGSCRLNTDSPGRKTKSQATSHKDNHTSPVTKDGDRGEGE